MGNTAEMAARIEAAFENSSLDIHTCTLAFEHGQWWVTCPDCGAQWSVVDAEGPGSIDGFHFEEVTEGDADAHAEESEDL